MKRQRGLSLVGLIIVGILVALAAVLALKVVPAYVEYFTILKNVKALVSSGETKGASVSDVRRAFERRAGIDDITSVTPQDLEITKEGGEVVIRFAYSRKLNLVGNVNLCIDFEGSTLRGR